MTQVDVMHRSIRLDQNHQEAIRSEIGYWLRILLSKEPSGLPNPIQRLLMRLRQADVSAR